jgi:hypothetical protein
MIVFGGCGVVHPVGCRLGVGRADPVGGLPAGTVEVPGHEAHDVPDPRAGVGVGDHAVGADSMARYGNVGARVVNDDRPDVTQYDP